MPKPPIDRPTARLPKLSIAAKLYSIFGLLAIVTAANAVASNNNNQLATNISSVNRAIAATKESSGQVLSGSEHLAVEADHPAKAVARFFDELRAGPGRKNEGTIRAA